MLVDPSRPVPHDLVTRLCELATWAPNHKRTWPWRFALLEGDARGRLGNVIADAMDAQGDPPEKVQKARGKYLRTPATLVVGTAAGDSPLRTAENRDAVAAGIQNLLLAATAAGLATYWGSCPKGANDVVADARRLGPGHARDGADLPRLGHHGGRCAGASGTGTHLPRLSDAGVPRQLLLSCRACAIR